MLVAVRMDTRYAASDSGRCPASPGVVVSGPATSSWRMPDRCTTLVEGEVPSPDAGYSDTPTARLTPRLKPAALARQPAASGSRPTCRHPLKHGAAVRDPQDGRRVRPPRLRRRPGL